MVPATFSLRLTIPAAIEYRNEVLNLKDMHMWDDEDDKNYAANKTSASQQQNQQLAAITNRAYNQSVQATAPKAKPPLENLFNQLPKEIERILSQSNRVDELIEDKCQNAAGYLSLLKDNNVDLETRETVAQQLSTVLDAERVQKNTAQNRLNELLKEKSIDIKQYQQQYNNEHKQKEQLQQEQPAKEKTVVAQVNLAKPQLDTITPDNKIAQKTLDKIMGNRRAAMGYNNNSNDDSDSESDNNYDSG